GLAALAARGLLLRRRAALGGTAARARLLAAAARGARRVGDPRRALLRHALVLQGLVLLLVLDAWPFVGHVRRFPGCKSDETTARSLGRARATRPRRKGPLHLKRWAETHEPARLPRRAGSELPLPHA